MLRASDPPITMTAHSSTVSPIVAADPTLPQTISYFSSLSTGTQGGRSIGQACRLTICDFFPPLSLPILFGLPLTCSWISAITLLFVSTPAFLLPHPYPSLLRYPHAILYVVSRNHLKCVYHIALLNPTLQHDGCVRLCFFIALNYALMPKNMKPTCVLSVFVK